MQAFTIVSTVHAGKEAQAGAPGTESHPDTYTNQWPLVPSSVKPTKCAIPDSACFRLLWNCVSLQGHGRNRAFSDASGLPAYSEQSPGLRTKASDIQEQKEVSQHKEAERSNLLFDVNPRHTGGWIS